MIERIWIASLEMCFALTIFKHTSILMLLPRYGLLLFTKCVHWLLADRLEHVRPAIHSPRSTHIIQSKAIHYHIGASSKGARVRLHVRDRAVLAGDRHACLSVHPSSHVLNTIYTRHLVSLRFRSMIFSTLGIRIACKVVRDRLL
jgi:hypothetical protein